MANRSITKSGSIARHKHQPIYILHYNKIKPRGEVIDCIHLVPIHQKSEVPTSLPEGAIIIAERDLRLAARELHGKTSHSRLMIFDGEEELNHQLELAVGSLHAHTLSWLTITYPRPALSQSKKHAAPPVGSAWQQQNISPTSQVRRVPFEKFWEVRVVQLGKKDISRSTEALISEIIQEHESELKRRYPRSLGPARIALRKRIEYLKEASRHKKG